MIGRRNGIYQEKRNEFSIDEEMKHEEEEEEETKKNEEEEKVEKEPSSFLQSILFSEFGQFVKRANTVPLSENDIWPLKQQFSTEEIRRNWLHYENRSFIRNWTLRLVFQVCKSNLAIGGLYELLRICFAVLNPFVLKFLIDFFENRESIWRGCSYVILLTVSGFLGSLCETHAYYQLNLAGFKMKTAVMAAVYEKSLLIPQVNGGEVVSHVSIDCQWLLKAARFVHLPWSCPLQILVTLYMLYDILHSAIFSGISVIVVICVLSFVVAKFLKRFQEEQLEKKDARLRRTMEVLTHFIVVKLNCWEEAEEEKIGKLREDEIHSMRRFLTLQALQVFLWNCGIFVFGFSAFATFSFYSRTFHIQTVFVAVALVNSLRVPFRLLPSCLTALSQGVVSIRRIDKFLSKKEVDSETNSKKCRNESVVQLHRCSYSLENRPILKDVSLSADEETLTVIVGKVGSGKSALLSALAGELNRKGGTAFIRPGFVFVTQNIWLQSGSIRDNILFGNRFRPIQYDKVVAACCLKEDFEQFVRGDLTKISGNGSTLSGGQRQRIGLARAVYRNAQTYLLDDPLSACDPHLRKRIFHSVIGPKGMLRNKTRILVTNQSAILPLADKILVMQNGESVYEGDFKDFKANLGTLESYVTNDETQEKEESGLNYTWNVEKESDIIPQTLDDYDSIPGTSIPLKLYRYYFENLGTFPVFMAIGGYLVSQAFDVGSKLWLSHWTHSTGNVTNNFDYNENMKNVAIYGVLGCSQSLMVFFSVLLINSRTLKASTHFHQKTLHRMIRAPLTFFWCTPRGTIMNRLSKDMDETDMILPNTLKNLAYQTVKILGTLMIAIMAFPAVVVFIVLPLGVIFIKVVKSYLMASRFLKRTSSTRLASLLKHFGDSAVSGASTIRCYRVEKDFIKEHLDRIESHQSVYFMELIAESWLFLRLQFIAGAFIGLLALALVLFPSNTHSNSLSALSLTSSLTVLQDVFLFTRYAAVMEKAMVAIERIKECQDLIPRDPTMQQPLVYSEETSNRHQRGFDIRFEKFSGRYYAKRSTLRNLSFVIGSGEKVGVVGRTGSGKSSLIVALSGLMESEEGNIYVGGIDITTSRLSRQIRKQHITVIPQEAALFSGTIRSNLDPEDRLTDDVIWNIIESVDFKDFFTNLDGGLDFELNEDGSNLSLGEKQIICCVRSLMSESKLVIMDEATSAMTVEMEQKILTALMTHFDGVTIVVITHRLKPILHCDKILVLNNGSVQEYGETRHLVEDKRSIFNQMLRNSELY